MSGVGFGSGLILFIIGLGHDLHWWRMDNETYDTLATVWTSVTVAAAFIAGVIARFTMTE